MALEQGAALQVRSVRSRVILTEDVAVDFEVNLVQVVRNYAARASQLRQETRQDLLDSCGTPRQQHMHVPALGHSTTRGCVRTLHVAFYQGDLVVRFRQHRSCEEPSNPTAEDYCLVSDSRRCRSPAR